MSESIESFVASINWPNDILASQFVVDCDMFWGTEEGRKQILSWRSLLGKPSQFLQRQLWTVADLIEHNRLHDEWLLTENKVSDDELEELPHPEPKGSKSDAEIAARRWHDAVRNRKLNLALSREWVDKEIEKLRRVHFELDREWTDYVSQTREELKRVRGY